MIDVAAYCQRIGYQGAIAPTLATLRALHLAHLYAAPFENLDIHLGRPIVLDEALLFDKIVRQRRGGFCYELNGLFAALLRDIGFAVTLLAAQMPRADGEPGIEMDHLVLLVRPSDSAHPWLADVAAGRGSFALPMRLDTTEADDQPEAGASFRLLPEGEVIRLWRRGPGDAWEREYRFTLIPRVLADFDDGCRFHQTSPDSHFTQQRVCMLLRPDGRVTLSERRLIVTRNGTRHEQELADETAVRRALRAHFGIDLSR